MKRTPACSNDLNIYFYCTYLINSSLDWTRFQKSFFIFFLFDDKGLQEANVKINRCYESIPQTSLILNVLCNTLVKTRLHEWHPNGIFMKPATVDEALVCSVEIVHESSDSIIAHESDDKIERLFLLWINLWWEFSRLVMIIMKIRAVHERNMVAGMVYHRSDAWE